MRIDTHIHITPPDIIRDYKKIEDKEPYFKMLCEAPHNKFATADDVVNHLKYSNFDKGIVFGFSFQDMGLCRYVNDYTMDSIKRYPNELIGFMAIPANHKEITKEIDRCYKGGLKGVGELFPEGQQLDIANLHKTDLKACCLEYNLPLLIHTNELVGHYYAGKTSVPLEHIEAFINSHKEIPIILAHFGGGLLFYELMNEIKSNFSNVYYDTAASLFLYNKKIYNVIREIGVMDKILFGSDYPLLPIERYEASLNELSEEEKSKIMGDNALKLLKKCRAL